MFRTPSLFRASVALVAFCTTATPQPAFSATADGRFAIKGAGLQTCAAFATAFDTGSPDLTNYAGWLDGFVTGHNQFNARTFDFLPWQTTETALGLTKYICDNSEPSTGFGEAVVALLRVLAPQRLTEASEATPLNASVGGTVIYQAVVARVADRLRELGHLTGDAGDRVSETDMTSALEAFQTAEDLPPSGVPDQATLTRLFVR